MSGVESRVAWRESRVDGWVDPTGPNDEAVRVGKGPLIAPPIELPVGACSKALTGWERAQRHVGDGPGHAHVQEHAAL